MRITSTIGDLLKVLLSDTSEEIIKHSASDGSIKLFSNSNQLLEINDNQLILCNHDITDKLLAKSDNLDKTVQLEDFSNFVRELSGSLLRLNHLGISYAVSDFTSEIESIKKIVDKTGFDLYEEPSGDSKSRWLFVGDASNWESPLFEIVLTEGVILENIWRPHFQIDIDTDLDQEKLESLLIKYFGKDFIQWRLDIPDYGVVLEMGILGSINGSKIYLGIGTKLRSTQSHRKEILKIA